MALQLGPRLPVRLPRGIIYQNSPIVQVGTSSSIQTRCQSTKQQTLKIDPLATKESQKILASQRLNRPVAPHLSIYKFQVSSVLSGLERITGIIFSGSLYLFSTAYLVSPYIEWDLSSLTLGAAFGALPLVLKVGAKFVVAWPFTFHCFNGVRNLIWTSGKFLANRQVTRSGMVTVGFATVGAVGLACFV